jgi:hypothetical protein
MTPYRATPLQNCSVLDIFYDYSVRFKSNSELGLSWRCKHQQTHDDEWQFVS